MPTQCCLLGVCCPPEQRASELAQYFKEADPEATEKSCEKMANKLLEEYDVAPHGFSAFILEKYGPSFK